MKKVSKILLLIAIILAFIIIPQVSFAVTDDLTQWDISMSQAMPSKVANFVGVIIKALRNLSIVLTVLVITVLGIKYMIGSVQEKADYKKNYINIIIGVVLISMITTIVNIIFTAAQN